MLRVQREATLEAKQAVEAHKPKRVEAQQTEGVDEPILFAIGVNAGQPVDQALDRPQDRVQKSAFAREYLGHVTAQRGAQADDDDDEASDLQPPAEIHARHPRSAQWPGRWTSRRTANRAIFGP